MPLEATRVLERLLATPAEAFGIDRMRGEDGCDGP
jgi:hypothetical protein